MRLFKIFLFLCFSFGLWAQAPGGEPVVLGDQAVFQIKASMGGFTAQDRAKAISQRLKEVSENPFRELPPFIAQENPHYTNLLCGDVVLVTITEDDARMEGVSRAELAKQRLSTLESVLRSKHWKSRIRTWLTNAFWIVIVTALGFILYRLVSLGALRLRGWVSSVDEDRFFRVRLQKLELISSAKIRASALAMVGFLRLAALALLGYLYLSIIFSFFPATKGLAAKLLKLVMDPLGVMVKGLLDYMPKLFFLALIGVITYYLLKLIQLVFKGIQSGALNIPNFHVDWAEPTYRLTRFFVFAFALVVAFPYLPGSGSEAFKGVSLLFGLMFSLGSSGAVGNAVAGVLITYMRPFQLGDRIAVGDTTGDVVEKSLLVTRIRTVKNVDVTLPNSMLLGAQVQNFSANARKGELILHTGVTIGYDVPWRTVHRLLLDAAKATPGVFHEPSPFVLQTGLEDFYVAYQINVYTDQASSMARMLSDLHANIQEKFKEAGVEIMSPHYRAQRDGNASTIPV